MYSKDTGCFGTILLFLTTMGAGYLIWALISIILAWPLSLLWNWLLPHLFSFPRITFIQAFGLEILSGLLFGVKFSLDRNGKTE